jgi:hypothetical protein
MVSGVVAPSGSPARPRPDGWRSRSRTEYRVARGPCSTTGTAVRWAAGDVGKVDDCEVIMAGLRNLRGSDIAILRHMTGGDALFWRDGSPPDEESRLPNETYIQASIMGLPEDAYVFALTRLANQGFARSFSVLGGTRFEITHLGNVLCDALQLLADSGQGVSMRGDAPASRNTGASSGAPPNPPNRACAEVSKPGATPPATPWGRCLRSWPDGVPAAHMESAGRRSP